MPIKTPAIVGTILTDSRGQPTCRRPRISRFPTVRWIFHQRLVKKQEARGSRLFLFPFSLAVPRRRLFLHPSRSRRQVLLSREMRRYRFKRTRRALLCQRPNRKSQLLRASPSSPSSGFLRSVFQPRCSSM